MPLPRWAIAVDRMHADQPWRAACACGRPLWSNAVLPPGLRTGGGRRIGAPPYTVEAVAALAAIALPLSGWLLAAFAWRAAGMSMLAFVDLAVMRLPPRITAVTAAGFLGLLPTSNDPPAWQRAIAAVVAGFFGLLAARRADSSAGMSPSRYRPPRPSAGTAGPRPTPGRCSAAAPQPSPRSP